MKFNWSFFETNNDDQTYKLLEIKRFGDFVYPKYDRAFNACKHLKITAADQPLLEPSVTSLIETWSECEELEQLPHQIDTSSVINFGGAWEGCKKLKEFPSYDTSKGEDFTSTWSECRSLLAFPRIDTSSGRIFRFAWGHCVSLSSFPQIDTSNGTDFYGAWTGCYSLTAFPALDLSNGLTLQEAWYNCSSLTSFPSAIKINSASYLAKAWNGCSSLTAFPALNISNTTSLKVTWENCSSLKNFPFLSTGNVTDFEDTWRGCSSLSSFPPLDFHSATIMDGTWKDCSSLLYFPYINTDSCSSFKETWSGCSSLRQIGNAVQYLNVSNVVNADGFESVFDNCIALSAVYLQNISTNISFSGTNIKCQELQIVFNNLITTGTPLTINVKNTPASTTELNTIFPTITGIATGKGWTVIW